MADDLVGGSRQALKPPESLTARVGSLDRLTPLFAAVLFVGAVGLLHHELAAYSYREVTAAVAAVRPSQLVWGVALTVLAYAVLPGYDAMALSYIGHPLPLHRTAAVRP
jgi:phosphatidylglycerol lysyltransferase